MGAIIHPLPPPKIPVSHTPLSPAPRAYMRHPATGELIALAPLPAQMAVCPACGGFVKWDGRWMCRACAWTEAQATDKKELSHE